MPALHLDKLSLSTNPRATLSAWTKYQQIVERAYTIMSGDGARQFSYSPPGMSAATVVSRLRDACRGCIAFEYPLTLPIDRRDFRNWYEAISIVQRLDQVVIAFPDTLKTRPPIEPLSAPTTKTDKVFDKLEAEHVAAFCKLMSAELITTSITIMRPDPIYFDLEQHYPSLNFVTPPDGSLIIF